MRLCPCWPCRGVSRHVPRILPHRAASLSTLQRWSSCTGWCSMGCFSAGLPLHTPAIMQGLSAVYARFTVQRRWSHPSPKGIKEYGLGLGTFTNLEEKLLVCTVPDPLRPQEDKHNEAEVVTVTTHAGRRGITAGDYMDTMQAAQPDVIVSIADFQSHRAGRKRQQYVALVSPFSRGARPLCCAGEGWHLC